MSLKEAKEFISLIDAVEGERAYLVGGCVRDIILKKEPKDYDIACSLTPEKLIELCKGKYKTIPTGIDHGTVTVAVEGENFEVTTFRHDHNCDGRHANITYASKIEEDLARRDFTINAMAMDLDGNVIDLFGGREDLKRGLIRCVGDPNQRFKEDYLRMMRAIRFSCQLRFPIESKTESAINKRKALLTLVSKERIRDELVKALVASPGDAHILLTLTGILEVIIPELTLQAGMDGGALHNESIEAHTYWTLQEAKGFYGSELTPIMAMATLLHDVAKPICAIYDPIKGYKFNHHDIVGAKMAQDIMHRLRFSIKEIMEVSKIIRYHLLLNEILKPGTIKKYAAKYGFNFLYKLAEFRRIDGLGNKKKDPSFIEEKYVDTISCIQKVEETNPILTVKDLAINGKDLIELGVDPGPDMGRLFDRLLDMVSENPDLNTKDKLCELAMKRW